MTDRKKTTSSLIWVWLLSFGLSPFYGVVKHSLWVSWLFLRVRRYVRTPKTLSIFLELIAFVFVFFLLLLLLLDRRSKSTLIRSISFLLSLLSTGYFLIFSLSSPNIHSMLHASSSTVWMIKNSRLEHWNHRPCLDIRIQIDSILHSILKQRARSGGIV